MTSISQFLWFDGQAEQAANFYISIFPNSRMLSVARYPEGGPAPAGSAMSVSFVLDGLEIQGLNADRSSRSPRPSPPSCRSEPKRRRRFVEPAHQQRWRAWSVRLVERPIRFVVAGGADDARSATQRPRPGAGQSGDGNDDGPDQDHHRRPAGLGRHRVASALSRPGQCEPVSAKFRPAVRSQRGGSAAK